MLRKYVALGFLCFCTLNLLASDLASESPNKTGYALLEKVIDMFHGMATTGSGGFEKVDKTLQGIMAEAKKAKAQAQIDNVFFNRYARLLTIIKLGVIPDPEAILSPLINKEIGQFVEETLGEEMKFSREKSIGLFSAAIADELLNLQLYLDDIPKKVELMKRFQARFTDAVK